MPSTFRSKWTDHRFIVWLKGSLDERLRLSWCKGRSLIMAIPIKTPCVSAFAHSCSPMHGIIFYEAYTLWCLLQMRHWRWELVVVKGDDCISRGINEWMETIFEKKRVGVVKCSNEGCLGSEVGLVWWFIKGGEMYCKDLTPYIWLRLRILFVCDITYDLRLYLFPWLPSISVYIGVGEWGKKEKERWSCQAAMWLSSCRSGQKQESCTATLPVTVQTSFSLSLMGQCYELPSYYNGSPHHCMTLALKQLLPSFSCSHSSIQCPHIYHTSRLQAPDTHCQVT